MALFPGALPVAVAATHLALFNLSDKPSHAPSKPGDGISDVGTFRCRIYVVELKNNGIVFAAIHAWV